MDFRQVSSNAERSRVGDDDRNLRPVPEAILYSVTSAHSCDRLHESLLSPSLYGLPDGSESGVLGIILRLKIRRAGCRDGPPVVEHLGNMAGSFPSARSDGAPDHSPDSLPNPLGIRRSADQGGPVHTQVAGVHEGKEGIG